jgi:hypothetical protein
MPQGEIVKNLLLEEGKNLTGKKRCNLLTRVKLLIVAKMINK